MPDAGRRPALPKAAAYYADRTTVVASAGVAAALFAVAWQRPLSHIGFDTEFKHDQPGVVIGRDRTAHDPRGLILLIPSLSLAEPVADGDFSLSNSVVDLRQAETGQAPAGRLPGIPAAPRQVQPARGRLNPQTQANRLRIVSEAGPRDLPGSKLPVEPRSDLLLGDEPEWSYRDGPPAA